MRMFEKANYDFVRVRRRAMLFSALIIVAGMISIAIRGGLEPSIDFSGGALIEISLEREVPVQDVRAVVTGAGFEDAEITRFGQQSDYLIKVRTDEDGTVAAGTDTLAAGERAISKRIEDALQVGFAGQKIEVRRVETVGPKIGSELRKAAFGAVIYSLLGILIYITWRFQFRFAVAAIIAIVHDALVMLAFFSFAGLEISISGIAAILTILGYSLSDTVVVFDRIRENLALRKREDLGTLINTSINETLSRTFITAGTVMLTLIALLVFGGEVIREFALAMTVGTIAGTYSSVFIAAPILLEWEKWRPARAKK